MKNLPAIDATPVKRIYTSIIADYDLKKSICELIDNAIDNAKNVKLKNVLVNVLIDVDSQTITIEDNSGGIMDLRNVIAPGATSNDLSKDVIGMFGVGSKRAAVALAKNIVIKTRAKNKNTKLLKYDEEWINSDTWSIIPQEAENDLEQISETKTIVELFNLRKPFTFDETVALKKHVSEVYANFIKSTFLKLYINAEEISFTFFDNWTYSTKYPPVNHHGTLTIGRDNITVSIIAGLSTKSSPTGEWGVYFYFNDRLIEKEVKNLEVGIASGFAGKPHASISLLKVFVNLNGIPSCMPWNSSKSGIDYAHQVYKLIQERLQEIVTTYAKISRALEGKWEDELFKYKSGKIKKKSIKFDKPLKSNLPLVPPSKSSTAEKFGEQNKTIFKKKPWTRGVIGGIQVKELIGKKEFLEKNRYLLIVLDSTLEIAFKEFLVYGSGNHYNDTQLQTLFSKRHLVHLEVKKYSKGKLITNTEWDKIKYYNDIRNQLIHKRAAVNIVDEDIEDLYKIVKSVVKKLFNLNFTI